MNLYRFSSQGGGLDFGKEAPPAPISYAKIPPLPETRDEMQVIAKNTQRGLRLGANRATLCDRADCVDLGFCQNGFDEIKNQWGWGGYSTQDIERCALSARAVALIYNGWSWYVRLANPKTRLEAKTSRPKLLK